ncbi:MAG: HAD family hydrolase [Thaumarchaeota archaeon]|nr:HAD family hydrolase [Nitrososphaerota archaeon]
MLDKAKAVLFDLFGTLVSYDLDNETPIRELFRSLSKVGLELQFEVFRNAYVEARRKYQAIRYEKLVEITNTVWLSDALENLGVKNKFSNTDLEKAIDDSFKPFCQSTELLAGSLESLKASSDRFKIGVVTNFTYAPVVHNVIKRLSIDSYFQTVAISDEIGYRKPHPKIFEIVLQALAATPSDAVMVGNDPLEDIGGAKKLGMKTVLVKSSQYFENRDMAMSTSVQPDMTIQSMEEFLRLLP